MIVIFLMPFLGYLVTMIYIAAFGEMIVDKNVFEEWLIITQICYIIFFIKIMKLGVYKSTE